MTEKQRWQYRFDNFKRAYFLLQEAVELLPPTTAKKPLKGLDQLAQVGMIQRFEYCTELSWKTIKDYLESQNIVFAQITPKSVLKEAIACKLITNGDAWMRALDARNKMSHTYDFVKSQQVAREIRHTYLACFGELYEKLSIAYLGRENA